MTTKREADDMNWETVLSHRDDSVRRCEVPGGWLYQVQEGRRFNSVAGTLGRDRDQGVPVWSPPVFVGRVG